MNEQFNRRAMIRRVRAKSSLCYPEVFHRFCGYLRDAGKIFRAAAGARCQAGDG
jgi:hypothetical protein